jgi:hypothetical protein
MSNRASRFLFALALILCAAFVHAQVPVAMAPPIHFQFFNASGQPLANGFLYTYAAGTTTCLNTYVDATGTTQNPCVIPLDSTGSPSNGSTQTGIFLANNSYKFVGYDVNLVFQWSVDNVTSYFGLLNSANTWTGTQTFTGQIVDTLTDNQIVLGSSGSQTTLDAPPPLSGNIALHFPTQADTLVGQVTPATLQNKTLVLPNFTNACSANIPNQSPAGTTQYTATVLVNAPSQAEMASTSNTTGVIGITVSGAGTSGSACIQNWGQALCVFDGATTANDYVVPSTTVAGNCHDAGAIASGSQILGQVLSTNAAAGTYNLFLTGGGSSGGGAYYSSGVALTVPSTSGTFTAINSTSFGAGVLNTIGKTIRITAQVITQPGTTTNQDSQISFGTSASLNGTNINIQSVASASTNSNGTIVLVCAVATTGTSGTISCSGLNGGAQGAFAPTAVVTADLTSVLYVGTGCTLATANAGNQCTENLLTVERLN